jgi:hypothetical protein
MRLTWTVRIGMALMLLGIVTLACWSAWFRTRTWCPVDIPISLAQGTHFTTGEFSLNLNGQYDIEIDAKGKIPLDTLGCLLGNGMKSTCPIPPVVRLNWAVSHDGIIIRGKSDDFQGSGSNLEFYGEAYRTVGYFNGQKGQRYKVDVDVLADGLSLAPAQPHLRISVFDTSFESSLVVGGLLRLTCVVLMIVGLILLVSSFIAQRRRSRS